MSFGRNFATEGMIMDLEIRDKNDWVILKEVSIWVEAKDTADLPTGTPYECELCKEQLKTIPSPDGRRVVVEVASGQRHGCWQNYPHGGELLVTEDN